MHILVDIKKNWIQLNYLVPVVIAITLALIGFTIAASYFTSRDQNLSIVKHELSQTQQLGQSWFDTKIERTNKDLASIAALISSNQHTEAQFASRQTTALFNHLYPIYQSLLDRASLSDLRLILPDRSVLIDLSDLSIDENRVEHLTLLRALETQRISWGLELDHLNKPIIRLVYPWVDKQTEELIGYLEVSKDLNRLIDEFTFSTEYGAALILHKEQIDESSWKPPMHHPVHQWDYLKDVVVSYHTNSSFIVEQLNLLTDHHDSDEAKHELINYDGRSYYPVFVSLTNKLGEDIGDLVFFSDVSFQLSLSKRMLQIISIIALILGIPLLLFFNAQARKLRRVLDFREQNLKLQADVDGLTGLWNRRHFDERLLEELMRAARYDRALTLLMIDIDHFKRINDQYGHTEGDKVLKEVAKILQNLARGTDLTCRYGGEEMVLILPETSKDDAIEVARRINKTIADHPFLLSDKLIHEQITVSIGLASFPEDATEEHELINRADEALYQAKHTGRNRVVVYENTEAS